MLEYPEVRRRPFLLALERALTAIDSREGIADDLQPSAALILIDIVNLARINRMHGYVAGDIALAMASARLAEASTETDSVFRIGSHQFAFILPQVGNTMFIALAVNRLRSVLSDPVTVGDSEIILEIRIGTGIRDPDNQGALDLLARAENSVRHNSEDLDFIFMESEQDSQDWTEDRLRLEEAFVDSLNANAFELAYQPKINLKTGVVSGCEALLRWPQEGGGYISPVTTIDVAESLGHGYTLCKWVLSAGIRQAQQWYHSMGIKIAINVEASLIDNPDLYNLVSDSIALWDADSESIKLEVTESGVITDKESGFNNLLNLSRLGVELSIDDFGTGYSSLNYFKDIPAQELKIDQSFIRTITTDPQNRALVKVVVEIAHIFGMTVVAEGIEDEESLQAVRECGCDVGQGYYFSRPLPAEDFEAWVTTWKQDHS